MAKQISNYSKKLLDPRWQKCRLKILERDEFRCQICWDDSKTLHVHHRIYISGNDPWDYEDKLLVTLCCNCHELETQSIKELHTTFCNYFLSAGLFACDLQQISFEGEADMIFPYPSEVMVSVLSYFMRTHELQEIATKSFWAELNNRRKDNVLIP